MNQQITINALLKEFSIQDIEKQLILNYLNANNMDYKHSPYLLQYLSDFTPDDKLCKEIEILNHTDLVQITNDMGLLMPKEDKKTNGAFFTPSYIVDYIIQNTKPTLNETAVDLSCGSGAFILGLLRYYTATYGVSVSECVKKNIYGSDILGYNVERCKLMIILYGLTKNEIIDVNDINIFHCDSLKKEWEVKFDVIVGNPPYVKFQDLDDATRAYLFNNWTTTKLGTYNLYFAFFELGLKLLANNGRLGYITPNNYFTSLSGEPLRAFFQSKNCIYKIVDFNSTKVFDVQTYTAITFVNKRKNDVIQYDRIEDIETPVEFLNNIETTDNSYNSLSIKKWRLLCGEERHNIYQIEHCGDSLKSLFNICVGIATLKDDCYTFVPNNEDNGYYYINIDGVEYKVEKNITRPLVKISEMKSQQDLDNNKKRIIFPYYLDKENKPVLIKEDVLKQQYPHCYNYLLTMKDILAYRGKGNHVYEPFYQYGRTQTMNKHGKKLLTPTFSQFPRFLVDEYSDGLFTNGYGIYPNENIKMDLFNNNPITLVENFDVVQKILNSSVMHYYVKITSVSIEGGYPCYQKNFIERFTIPKLSNDDINHLRVTDSKREIDMFLMAKYQINLPEPYLRS